MITSDILPSDAELTTIDALTSSNPNTEPIPKDNSIISTNTTISSLTSELLPQDNTQLAELLTLNVTEYSNVSGIVVNPISSYRAMLLNPEIPVYDNAVSTDLSLNTDSVSNSDILGTYESIETVPDTFPGSGSIFPEDPTELPQINSLFELLQYLSEVMIRFNSNPKYYMQDDFAILVKTITNALIHLYLDQPLSTGEVEGIYAALATKVDKIVGKGLSTNDLTNELKLAYDTAFLEMHTHSNKSALDLVSGTNSGDQDLSNLVEKELGKGLSTNDYTTLEKNKVLSIQEGAEVNVNADWNATSGDALILNKPSLVGFATETYVQNYSEPKKGLDDNYVTDLEKANLHAPHSDDQDLTPYETIVNNDVKLAGKEPANSNIQAHIINTNNPHNVTKSQVGLGAVNNTSDINKPISTATQNALNLKLDTSLKGSTNGLAELDENGFVKNSQLPSYVDDVLEFTTISLAPIPGETGKIYVDLTTNITYRWGGSSYVIISDTIALGETSATAYRGDRGKIAYDHSQIITGNPHNTSKTDIGLGNVDNTSDINKPVSTAQKTYIDSGDRQISTGALISPTFTDNGNGTGTISSTSFNIFTTSNFSGNMVTVIVPSITLTFTDGAEEYVAVKYNSGTPTYYKETIGSAMNHSDLLPVFVIWRQGSVLHSLGFDSLGVGLANKLQSATYHTQEYRLSSDGGLSISESTSPNPRTINVTGGLVYTGAIGQDVNPFTSTTDQLTFAYHVGGVWNYTNHLVYNNTQYDNGTNLVNINNNKYAVRWYYRSIGDSNQVFYVAGTNGNYNNPTDAALEVPRTDLPMILKHHCMLVGRSIIQYNATSGVTQDLIQNLYLFNTTINHNDTGNIQLAGNGITYGHIDTNAQSIYGVKTFINSPTVPNITPLDNSTKVANTAYADTKLPLQSISDAKGLTGFIDGDNINVSYNYTNRTITLTGNLSYVFRGVSKILTSPWTSSSHTATQGSWFLYSNDGTNFVWSQTPWNFEDVMITSMRYGTSAATTFAIRETHGTMDYKTHEELHSQIGTYRVSGGQVTAGTYAFNTATDAANSPGFDLAVVKDEDNSSTIPAWVEGTYTTAYVGASNTMVFDVTSTLPFIATTNTFIQVNNPVTGTMTTGGNTNYYNVYQILIPTTSDVDSQKYRMIMLQPQNTYTSLSAAQSEDVRGLVLGNLSTLSLEFVIYARITYVTSNADNNIGKCRIATNGITYVIGNRSGQVSVSGFTGNNHSALSNLSWLTSGHIGSANKIPAFDARGLATELTTSSVVNKSFGTLTDQMWGFDAHPTTLSGYGIIDAIQNQQSIAQTGGLWVSQLIKTSSGVSITHNGDDNPSVAGYLVFQNPTLTVYNAIYLNASDGLSINNNINGRTFTISKEGNITALGYYTGTQYKVVGGVSSQFLKGDGSLDTQTYQPLSTAINTGNIGSQSVNYASNSGNSAQWGGYTIDFNQAANINRLIAWDVSDNKFRVADLPSVKSWLNYGSAANNNTGDFIQNQNSSPQPANMWINGFVSSDATGETFRSVGTNDAPKSLRLSNGYADAYFGIDNSTGVFFGKGAYSTNIYTPTGNLAITSLNFNLNQSGAATFSSTVNATQLQSTVATGTAPLTVNSTTMVSNLNSQYLGGKAASDFVIWGIPNGYTKDIQAAGYDFRLLSGDGSKAITINYSGSLFRWDNHDIYHSGNLTNNLSTNYIPKWNGSSFVNSLINDDGNFININSRRFSKALSNSIVLFSGGSGGLTINNNADSQNIINFADNGNVTIYSTTQSTSPTTGALVVNGGVGVGGNIYLVGGSSFIGVAPGASYTPDDYSFGGIIRNGGGFRITAAAVEQFTLQANGNLGLGYTSDQGYKLAVNGTGHFNGNVTASNFILSSDRTLKTNIQPITKDYSKLNLVSFNFKDNLEELRFGSIAQDLLNNGFDEFVIGNKEGEYKVKYIDLIIAKLASAESRIKQLEDKLNGGT